MARMALILTPVQTRLDRKVETLGACARKGL